MVACAKVIFFFVCLVVFALLLPKHYANRVLDDFVKLIFRFFGQTFNDNNLATSRSITWPHFSRIFWGKDGQVIDLEVFTCFLLKLCFFFLKNIILPTERLFLKKNKKL